MDEEQQKIKEHFRKNLKAEYYFEEMASFWGTFPEMFRFSLVFIHNVFRSERFKGSKLLEIGSGATVHNIAEASAYFPNIVMSDLSEDNVEQLKRWLRGESKLKQVLEIPAGLEGYGDDLETGRKMLEARVRKSVKHVSRCDVLTDNILLDHGDTPETSPPFDVVISCFCLECAPKDAEEYSRIIKRISALVRPGGGLIICGFIEGTPWKVRDSEFHHANVNEKQVRDSLVNAGFGKIDMKLIEKEAAKGNYEWKYEKVYCVAAEKL